MTLVVNELITPISQELVPTRAVNVYALRPHLYKHGSPAGSLTMTICDQSDNVLATSETIDIADLDAATYFHGYIRFLISCNLLEGVYYKFKLNSTGYSFSESAYVGWCSDYDLSKYGVSYTPASSLTCPMDIEVWEQRREF